MRAARLLTPTEAHTLIDPGFRTGCKIVCLDRQGMLRATARGAYDRISTVAEMPAAALRHRVRADEPRVA